MIDRHFSSLLGDLTNNEMDFDFSFKKKLEHEMEKQGLNSDLDSEIKNEIIEIREALENKYNHQLNIYRNFEYNHHERALASKVMDKHDFLFGLIDWLNNDSKVDDNEYFKYYITT